MKEKDKLEKFLEEVNIPSDSEVEAAGFRFDRRLRRIKMRRRMIWTSGAVAAGIAIALILPTVFTGNSGEGPVVQAEIQVPTLILSDGHSVKLEREKVPEKIKMPNILVADRHIYYDSIPAVSKKNTIPKEISYNTLVIPAGYTYAVTLADGSQVTLNAGSRLRYPVGFSGESREVELSGEAYFRVEKSAKAFVVNVGGASIRVYGTQFNVKTFRQTRLLETVLVEGSIGFTPPGREEVRIIPGDRLVYTAGDGGIEVRQVDTQNATAWMNGTFRYQEQKLNLILEDISAWYGVEVEAATDAADIELTLNLSKLTPFDEVISFLEQITSRTIKKEGGLYILK